MASAQELLIVAHLAPSCPFYIAEEHRHGWAFETIKTFKRKFPELWEGMLTHCTQQASAAIIVDVILRSHP